MTEVEKDFSHSTKIRTKTYFFSQENIFLKCSSRHVKSRFDNRAEFFSLNVRKSSAQSPKKTYEFILSKKVYFSSKWSSDNVECAFDNPAEFFCYLLEKKLGFLKKT